jgi:hypothetical protein
MRTSRAYNNSPASKSENFSPSLPSCVACGGSGWRPVLVNGDRRVTRCECRSSVTLKVPVDLDYKSAAAGER